MAEKERDPGEARVSVEALLDLVGRHTRLFVVATAGCVLASLAWVATKPPVFRATATLILDDQGRAGGILGDLAALTKAPQAASEMEILRARTTAEQAVARPSAAPGSDPAGEAQRHLGLTTLVEDPSLRPLASLFGGGSSPSASRLRAVLEGADGESALDELRVDFLARGRVRISPAGLGSRLGFGVHEPLETELRPGRPIEYQGMSLTLDPEGDLAGRSFHVVRLRRSQAVERVLGNTSVHETERSSGVIRLAFSDSDPVRAAETANALCQNYLDRNKARGEKRASQTVDFIDGQLDEQIEALHRAESEVVELQQKSPRAVNIGKTGEALITQVSALEVQRVQAKLMQVAVRQALDLLETGRADALSRLTAELADPITTAYVEQIARLMAERELQERSDAGAYKAMLQGQALELEARTDALELEIGALRAARDAVQAGDAQAVARLGSGPALSGDPLLAGYLAELAKLQGEHAQLARQLTESHPDRALLEQRMADAAQRIQGLLDNRLAGLEGQRREHGSLLASYRERTAAYPAGERDRIEAALSSLRARTITHLESRLAGLGASERSLADEIGGVEATLGSLPEEERVLADPMRRLSAHGEIVKFLLSRQQEAQITRAATIASAEFVDPAIPPARRHGPSIPLHLAAGLIAGAVLSLGLSLLAESLGRGVFSAAELEQVTELPVFGSIPDFRSGPHRVRGAAADFLPLRDDPEGPASEAYRSLRANLKFALSAAGDVRTLACTSCTQAEGKSLTNVALALSFAMNDKRVLLVDADMRRPSVHRYLGLELEPGLSDVLEGRLDWREGVRRGVHRNLDVITAGRQPHAPGDLLDSELCNWLLGELRASYDLIVLDVPPALAVADIDAVAQHLDAVILLARADHVSADVIASAAARLRQAGANLIGTVLNAVRSNLANRKYGYSYGYGYGYGNGSAGANGRAHRFGRFRIGV